MILAKVYPKTQYGKDSEMCSKNTIARSQLAHARSVIKHAPDLTEPVISGDLPLNQAAGYDCGLFVPNWNI